MAGPPHDDTDDEALEELDLDDAALLSQQSAAHAPVPRAKVDVVQPSVVLSDDLQADPAPPQPTPVRRRGKRSLEPTLVIRDRRKIDDLRRLRQQQAREAQKGRTRVILVWGFLGLLAFGLGGAIALFAARSRVEAREPRPATADEAGRLPTQAAPAAPSAASRFIDLDAPAPE